MVNRIQPHSVHRGGYTLTQSSTGLVTIQRPEGAPITMFANGRRLTLSTADGFLLAAGRDLAGDRFRPVFGSADMMIKACIEGGKI